MSQHDFDIANQTFPSFRSDLNDALQAAATISAGASAPTTTYPYQLWFDTANVKYMIRNAANSAWLNFVGIDTNGNVDVTGTVTASGDIIRNDATTGTSKFALQYSGADAAVFKRNNATGVATIANGYAGSPVDALNIDLAGNVGIGTAPESFAKLEVKTSTDKNIAIFDNAAGPTIGAITDAGGSASLRIAGSPLIMTGNGGSGAEHMRLLSSGDIAFGNTVANTVSGYNNQAGGGFVASDSHFEFATTANRAAVEIGKNNANDGQLVAFRKQGSQVGSIDVNGGKLVINSQGTNLQYATGGVVRMNNDASQFYSNTDNAMNLGIGSLRWNTLFASNGTINTSDANEKQQIAALTDAEMTAAKAISQLFKTFKWNDSVAEKGDAARTHTGVIAQDVQAAMSAAGLNAANYAFWCSDTWWETQTEVPAVEAVDAVYEDVVIPAVLDDDGNELEAERTEERTVTEAVEAVAAYTRTDTYDTAEEAPDGATERNRKGIRYPELLAFVGAATEQRLANIETRIAALEAN